MNSLILRVIDLSGLLSAAASAQTYTNLIRQFQLISGVQRDASVDYKGNRDSVLSVPVGGSRFELWTMLSSPQTNYLLDTKYVGTFVPSAAIAIHTEDPYKLIPRTRADRPFSVDVTINGLLNGAAYPIYSKSVTLLRHVQSYGAGGTGATVNRSQATLFSQASILSNGTQTLNYPVTSIPGADRMAIRGEERFSVFSLADPVSRVAASQLASQYVQIWPVARGNVQGIKPGQKLRFATPQLTMTATDLYPTSRVYAQIYKGPAALGTSATIIPGSAAIVNDAVPQERVILVKDYDELMTQDGQWTIELVTSTPFGTDRLASVTFTIDRMIRVNGNLNTQN
jgi:hypothetical protein